MVLNAKKTMSNVKETINMALHAPKNDPSGSGSDTFRMTVAGGTQDLGTLAGLFCTDSVEHNLLAIQHGYTSVVASSFSIRGLLRLMKAFFKLAIGLEKAANAGYVLDLSPILGYREGETTHGGDMVYTCSLTVSFRDTEVRIKQSRHHFNTSSAPMPKVAFNRSGEMCGKIGANLGNFQQENTPLQRPWG